MGKQKVRDHRENPANNTDSQCFISEYKIFAVDIPIVIPNQMAVGSLHATNKEERQPVCAEGRIKKLYM